MFNIGPTIIELIAICVIFLLKFGPGLVAATLVMVAVYITFTKLVTEWRAKLQREMNDVDNRAIGRAVDMVNVFRRAHDIPPHVEDIIAAKPKFVWFQLGIRNDAAAKQLAEVT